MGPFHKRRSLQFLPNDSKHIWIQYDDSAGDDDDDDDDDDEQEEDDDDQDDDDDDDGAGGDGQLTNRNGNNVQ